MEASTVRLRRAVLADSEFVFDVRRQAFRQYIELGEGWNEERELEQHIERFKRQRFRVITANSVDAGYMATAVYSATTNVPPNLYLHQLMVLPAFQSKRIGSACLRLLADEAQLLGLPIRLRVLRVNTRAFAFYIAFGFRVVAESEFHVTLEWR
jgi:ribosomal protein S18 acetylase RimI-like enzyme